MALPECHRTRAPPHICGSHQPCAYVPCPFLNSAAPIISCFLLTAMGRLPGGAVLQASLSTQPADFVQGRMGMGSNGGNSSSLCPLGTGSVVHSKLLLCTGQACRQINRSNGSWFRLFIPPCTPLRGLLHIHIHAHLQRNFLMTVISQISQLACSGLLRAGCPPARQAAGKPFLGFLQRNARL